MRIAFLTPVYPPYASGMGNAARSLAEEMARRGHEVTIVTPRYKSEIRNPKSETNSKSKISKIEYPISNIQYLTPRVSFGNAAWIGSFKDAIPSETDIVHLHWPFIGGIHALIKWKRAHPQAPIVVTYHMDLVSPPLCVRGVGGVTIISWLKGIFFRAYVRRALPKVASIAEKIVMTSYDYAKESQIKPLLDKEGLGEVDRVPCSLNLLSGRGDIIEIPLGVDTDRFSPGSKDPALMARYGIAPHDRMILTVSALDRAHAFKGISVLLDAMRRLPTTDYRLRLVIVGDGDLRASYERRVRELGIADRVIFAGRISDTELPEHYRLADVYALASTSRSEAFGISALEAMASGVPVVASDLPGVRTLIVPSPHPSPSRGEGESPLAGILVPPGDARALADAIARIFADDMLRQKLSSVARTRAVEEYSWEKVGEEYERVFEQVLAS